MGVVICQVGSLELATLSEKTVRYRCFAVNFVNFMKTASCRYTGNGCFGVLRSALRK